MTTSKTPNPPPVSIDIGAARTKLGYHDSSGDFRLVLTDSGEPYMPTTAAIGLGSTVLFGEDAEKVLEELEGPAHLPRALVNIKRSFGDKVRHLLAMLKTPEDPWLHIGAACFKKMREMASGEFEFRGQPPDVVHLTYSPFYTPPKYNLLRDAAKEAGFKTVRLVEEPIAAGQAFLREEANNLSSDVLLVDCGGLTLDITYLHRKPQSPNFKRRWPSATHLVGGQEVDRALIDQVRRAVDFNLKATRPVKVVELRVRRLKEAFCDGLLHEQCPIKVPRQDGPRAEQVQVVLKKTDFEDAIRKYIMKVCSRVVDYLAQSQLRHGLKQPGRELSLVLVGGSSQVPGLGDALVSRLNELNEGLGINPHLFPTSKFRAQYAVVMGALPVPPQHAGQRRVFHTQPEAEPEHDSSGTSTEPPEGMVLIPAGQFQMGSKVYSYSDEKPVHTVHLDAFYMDIHPVTDAQYQKFLDANPQWQKDHIKRKFHNGNYLAHRSGKTYFSWRASYPVVFVSWYAAMAYAKWAGKQLPTEAQWEYAARGGLIGKTYPWENNYPDPAYANYGGSYGWWDRLKKKLPKTSIKPVQQYPPNAYRLYDMAGNVQEWCLDAYDADFYSKSQDSRNPINAGKQTSQLLVGDFTSIPTDSLRVLRGGSWYSKEGELRVAYRHNSVPKFTHPSYGFRCVQAVTA